MLVPLPFLENDYEKEAIRASFFNVMANLWIKEGQHVATMKEKSIIRGMKVNTQRKTRGKVHHRGDEGQQAEKNEGKSPS